MYVPGSYVDIPQNGRRERIVEGNNPDDRNTFRIVPPDGFLRPLRYPDEELRNVTRLWTESPVSTIPGLRYWELGGERKMSSPVNICGEQQRAFDFYWNIRAGMECGGICLGLGTSSLAGPASLGTDKFYKDYTPNKDRYGDWQDPPHMVMDADERFPFFDGRFFGCFANHVLEHMRDPAFTLSEMLRVTRKGGFVWFIQPDMAFSRRGSIDPTHTHEFSSDSFWACVSSRASDMPDFAVMEWALFDNDFSFEAVLQRI